MMLTMPRTNQRIAAMIVMLLLFSLMPVFPQATSQAAPTNLNPTNPSFESPLSGTTIPGWSQTYGTSGISVTTERASSGTNSLKLVDIGTSSTNGSIGAESTKITVAPGKQVDATAQIYVDTQTTGSVTLSLQFWNTNNTLLHTETKGFTGSFDQWTTTSVSSIAPAGTDSVNILLYSSANGTSQANFDAVTLTTPETSNLGVQITSRNLSYSTFGKDANGNDFLYIGSNGSTSKFSVFNLSGNMILSVDLPGADAVWGMTVATDKSVYVGTSSGKLFRYIPGETIIHDLGVAIAGENYIWELAAGPSGTIYGGTYPGGKVFKYDPAAAPNLRFTAIGGQIEPGEQYVRSIAYDSSASKLYMGIGSHAHLIRSNSDGTQKTNILPAEYDSKEFTYYTNYVNGKIFAKMMPGNATLVIDKTSLAVDKTLLGITSTGVSQTAPQSSKVYYTKDAALYSYDLVSKTETFLKDVGSITNSTFIEIAGVMHLVGVTRGGNIIKYNITSNTFTSVPIIFPETPTDIRAVKLGPDGKIYTTGFLTGGMGVYNPTNGAETQIKGLEQAENLTYAGDIIYAGTYPGAVIEAYDVTSPASLTNPHELFNLKAYHQDRPFGMLAVPTLDKLFVGTVPSYGKLGGAFAIYDTDTAQLDVHNDLIDDQSIIALANKGTEVYGGTSIWGGAGIAPTKTEAKLFVWDTLADNITREIVPVAGKKIISELINGPDGNIWGIAEGTLFIFNPSIAAPNNPIIYSADKFPPNGSIWRDAKMLLANNGFIYIAIGGKLYRMNPSTKAVQELATGGVDQLTMDNNGDLYYFKGSELMKIDL